MPERNEYGHLRLKGDIDGDHILTGSNLSEVFYKDGYDAGIDVKSIRLRLIANRVYATVKKYINLDGRNAVTEENVGAVVMNCNTRPEPHCLEVFHTPNGLTTVLLDGQPVQAQELELTATADDTVLLNLKGIYLKKAHIDIHNLEDQNVVDFREQRAAEQRMVAKGAVRMQEEWRATHGK